MRIKIKDKQKSVFITIGIFLISLMFGQINIARAAEQSGTEGDKTLYEKYESFLNYEKHQKYEEYSGLKKKYEKYKKKYSFSSSSEKRKYKSAYKKYKKYKKNKSKYSKYKKYKKEYKKYRKYKSKYEPAKDAYEKIKKYKKYEEYNNSKYGKREFKQYGTDEYRQGWLRYTTRDTSTKEEEKVEEPKEGGGSKDNINGEDKKSEEEVQGAEDKNEDKEAGKVDNTVKNEEEKNSDDKNQTEEVRKEEQTEEEEEVTEEDESTAEEDAAAAVAAKNTIDKTLYEKYESFLNYEKHQKYEEYSGLKKKYEKYKKKYSFSSSSEKRKYKSAYKKYKKYKKNKSKYSKYKKYKKEYKKYRKYKSKYEPAKDAYEKIKKYKKYEEYNNSKYGKREFKQYGTDEYRQEWARYKQNNRQTQADLGGDSLGPEIKVGLFKFSKDDLKDGSFRVRANRDYAIKDIAGNSLGTIPAKTTTKVRYDSDGKLKISSSIESILVDREVIFEAVSTDEKDLIFEILSPHIDCYSSNCNKYRGKLKLRYSPYSKKIWLINVLPLEQYVWGMGEITGTGDSDYNDTMTTAYRTYGYWKIKYSTKFTSEGFEVNATPGNQLYFGHVWEEKHQRIKKAAQKTRGNLVMYEDRIAIVPYSSWTDGRTRSFKEKWGSDNFPWCQSVKDSYGKHPTKNYTELQASGNHMVGLSAHGALDRADAGWDYEKILKYYLRGIDIYQAY